MNKLIEDTVETKLEKEESKDEEMEVTFTAEEQKELENFESLNKPEIDLSLDIKV